MSPAAAAATTTRLLQLSLLLRSLYVIWNLFTIALGHRLLFSPLSFFFIITRNYRPPSSSLSLDVLSTFSYCFLSLFLPIWLCKTSGWQGETVKKRKVAHKLHVHCSFHVSHYETRLKTPRQWAPDSLDVHVRPPASSKCSMCSNCSRPIPKPQFQSPLQREVVQPNAAPPPKRSDLDLGLPLRFSGGSWATQSTKYFNCQWGRCIPILLGILDPRLNLKEVVWFVRLSMIRRVWYLFWVLVSIFQNL